MLEYLLGWAKKGMFDGDLKEGELEIGQVSGLINSIKPAAEILEGILKEYRLAIKESHSIKFNF